MNVSPSPSDGDPRPISRPSLVQGEQNKNDGVGERKRPEASVRARGRSFMVNEHLKSVRKRGHAARDHLSRRLHPDRERLHGWLEVHIIEARELQNLDTVGLSDPYVTVDVYRTGRMLCRLVKTRIIDDDLNPKWDEFFRLPLCYRADELRFTVKDKDVMGMQYIGYMSVSAKTLSKELFLEGWFDLRKTKKAVYKSLSLSSLIPSRKSQGSLRVKLKYTPVSSGILLGLSTGVPRTVFPQRHGCRVTLYQDAHTPAVPPLTDVKDRFRNPYQPRSLWMDIADAIEKAKRLILVVGWSVKTDLRLRRDGSSDELLGDALKKKAREGVVVLVMIWKEAMSNDLYPPGLMGTHDVATKNFFKGSGVEVLPAPRTKEKGKHMFESYFAQTAYTHHQKCVILDAAGEGQTDRRRLVGFVGGLDLTDGRWDTPSHELFKTLPNEHRDDFYNGICPATIEAGPREPWHDIHMRVEGPVVFDLLTNFEQRWRRQGKSLNLEDKLPALSDTEFDLHSQVEEDETRWTVQFFRSIGSDSVDFDEDTVDALLSSKGRKYENSIQQAYIHQIRRANRFIYIENQYFLGSSHGWVKKETQKCPHLIPLEITRRIIRAIESGDDFRVYITIPLHAEGSPTGSTVQEILRWQFRTIEMMYRKIGKAIEKHGVDAVPQDYLLFFCLGKRESPGDVPSTLEQPAKKSVSKKVRESLRFMIYVHSKFAIFDDEYVIVGSANINERSMSGSRDTEMAMGAYQPYFTSASVGDGNEVEGDIRTFRLALWAEHCGNHMSEHLAPASSSCMNAMKQLGNENLAKFNSSEVGRSDSHLMTYPLLVTRTGHVFRRLDNFGRFPDTGGSIKGHNSLMLPNSLTT